MLEQVEQKDSIGNSVLRVDIGRIIPNPKQPRKVFTEDKIAELAESIKQFGILQPLLVALNEQAEYILVAGERRLRAAKVVGLEKVPVILSSYTDKEIAEVAMIENLQREDLHFLEEAVGYESLIAEFKMTQESMAKRVGKKQSTIANKLRLLKLSPEAREFLFGTELTERHARALLKVPAAEQLIVATAIMEKKLNVNQTEQYIDRYLKGEDVSKVQRLPQRVRYVKDARIFVNSFQKVVDEIKTMGIAVKLQQEVVEEDVVITIRFPNRKKQ